MSVKDPAGLRQPSKDLLFSLRILRRHSGQKNQENYRSFLIVDISIVAKVKPKITVALI